MMWQPKFDMFGERGNVATLETDDPGADKNPVDEKVIENSDQKPDIHCVDDLSFDCAECENLGHPCSRHS